MICPESRLADSECVLDQHFGASVVTLVVRQDPQTVERIRHIGIGVTQVLAPKFERALGLVRGFTKLPRVDVGVRLFLQSRRFLERIGGILVRTNSNGGGTLLCMSFCS